MPFVFALAVLATPALLAQEHVSGPPSHISQAPVPDHSVSGVVKTIDKARLVITRQGKTPVEMSFDVIPSTLKEGVIAVGAKVQVRFRGDGRDGHPAVATAILATPHR